MLFRSAVKREPAEDGEVVKKEPVEDGETVKYDVATIANCSLKSSRQPFPVPGAPQFEHLVRPFSPFHFIKPLYSPPVRQAPRQRNRTNVDSSVSTAGPSRRAFHPYRRPNDGAKGKGKQ